MILRNGMIECMCPTNASLSNGRRHHANEHNRTAPNTPIRATPHIRYHFQHMLAFSSSHACTAAMFLVASPSPPPIVLRHLVDRSSQITCRRSREREGERERRALFDKRAAKEAIVITTLRGICGHSYSPTHPIDLNLLTVVLFPLLVYIGIEFAKYVHISLSIPAIIKYY